MTERRRRRAVCVTTTIAALSSFTTSLSHVLTSALPFVAQQLHAAASYVDYSQRQSVYNYSEHVQLTYNYSREICSWRRDYYNRTAALTTSTPTAATTGQVVVDVEAGTTKVSSSSRSTTT